MSGKDEVIDLTVPDERFHPDKLQSIFIQPKPAPQNEEEVTEDDVMELIPKSIEELPTTQDMIQVEEWGPEQEEYIKIMQQFMDSPGPDLSKLLNKPMRFKSPFLSLDPGFTNMGFAGGVIKEEDKEMKVYVAADTLAGTKEVCDIKSDCESLVRGVRMFVNSLRLGFFLPGGIALCEDQFWMRYNLSKTNYGKGEVNGMLYQLWLCKCLQMLQSALQSHITTAYQCVWLNMNSNAMNKHIGIGTGNHSRNKKEVIQWADKHLGIKTDNDHYADCLKLVYCYLTQPKLYHVNPEGKPVVFVMSTLDEVRRILNSDD